MILEKKERMWSEIPIYSGFLRGHYLCSGTLGWIRCGSSGGRARSQAERSQHTWLRNQRSGPQRISHGGGTPRKKGAPEGERQDLRTNSSEILG